MVNYILADYKRVVSRIPRLIFLVIYEVVFVCFVLSKWSKATGNYNSVALLEHSSYFFTTWMFYLLFVVDFIQSFSYDFSAKTIQVALGIGVTRLQVILSKLIQATLVMFTDFLVTFGVFGILCVVTGTPMAGHQIMSLVHYGMGSILLAILTGTLILPLVFRTQNMVITLVAFFILAMKVFTHLLRFLTRLGPVFLARLQLDRFTHDSCVEQVLANALTGNFQLIPWIGVILWFAIGIYLTWLFFRKMELDF